MINSPIYIFGEVLFDCFPESPPVLGGAPFNVAWHLRAFGLNPYLVSKIGNDDLGKKIQQAMVEWDLSTEFLQIDNEHSTGIVSVSIENGEPKYDIRENVSYDFIHSEKLPLMEARALFYHGSLALRHQQSRSSFAQLQQQHHTRRFIDVNLRSPWWQQQDVLASLYDAFCVKLNAEELCLLADISQSEIADHETMLRAAKGFKRKYNLSNLLVTQGDQGAVLIDTSNAIHTATVAPALKPVVDTVGAGDAFTAVTILGIQQHWDWQTTVERAQQFASFIVTQRGATCSNPSSYQNFCRTWHLT